MTSVLHVFISSLQLFHNLTPLIVIQWYFIFSIWNNLRLFWGVIVEFFLLFCSWFEQFWISQIVSSFNLIKSLFFCSVLFLFYLFVWLFISLYPFNCTVLLTLWALQTIPFRSLPPCSLKAEILKKNIRAAAAGIQRQTRSSLSILGGRKSPVGQSQGQLPSLSLSQSGRFALAESIQSGFVGSVLPCPCQRRIQAFLTRARLVAPVRLPGPDSPSSRTHVVWPAAISAVGSTHMTTASEFDRVWQCVFVQLRFMTLFVPVGWQKALTLGSSQQQKVCPFYPPSATLEFGQALRCVCAPGMVVCTTQRSATRRMIKLLNKECHDDVIVAYLRWQQTSYGLQWQFYKKICLNVKEIATRILLLFSQWNMKD